MSLQTFLYQLDVTGLLAANRITNEQHTIQQAVGPMNVFIVPNAAPFFKTGLIVSHVSGGAPVPLVEGVDYILTHKFVEASAKLGKLIFGSISILNRNLTGTIQITYQTLGGAFTLDDTNIVVQLTQSLYQLRTVTWDQILGVPVALPPLQHQQSLDDLAGFEDLVAAMEQLSQTINDVNAPVQGSRTFPNPDVIIDPNNIDGLAGRGHYRITSPGFELFVANVVAQVNNADLTSGIGTGEGILSIIQEGTFILQVYTPASLNSGVTFIRRRVGGVWGLWTARPTLNYITQALRGTAISPIVVGTSASLNTVTEIGIYRTSSVEGTLMARDAPVNLHGIVTVLIHESAPDLIRQEYRPISNNSVWSRTRTAGGVWGVWVNISAGIGVEQEWLDQTGSRIWNTWYTNTSGRPRMVTITVNDHEEADVVRVNVRKSAVFAPVIIADLVYRAGAGGAQLATDTVTFVVPAGADYQLAKAGGAATIKRWVELV